MSVTVERCPCGRPNCWHVNIQEYCARQAATNRVVSAVYSVVIMGVVIYLLFSGRRP